MFRAYGYTNVVIKIACECERPSCHDCACKFIVPTQCTTRWWRAPIWVYYMIVLLGLSIVTLVSRGDFHLKLGFEAFCGQKRNNKSYKITFTAKINYYVWKKIFIVKFCTKFWTTQSNLTKKDKFLSCQQGYLSNINPWKLLKIPVNLEKAEKVAWFPN